MAVELKLTGENGIRNKIIKVFCCVIILNAIFDFFLYKYNSTELGIKNSIILLLGFYIVYWILNLYIIFLKRYRQNSNYSILSLTGTIVCIFVLIILFLNLKHDLILFFSMMYVVSMLDTFINWITAERKQQK